MSPQQPLAVIALLGLAWTGILGAQPTPIAPGARPNLAQIEQTYADFNDAQGAVSLIDSDPARYAVAGYEGRSRDLWQQRYLEKRAELSAGLRALPASGRSAADARAARLMGTAVADSSATPDSLAPVGRCAHAAEPALALGPLQQALYACFAELGNSLEFEGARVTRVAAFELLTSMPEPQRRKDLFLAFMPLWRALNGAGEAGSPYRRMIRMAAAEARIRGSAVEAAAHTLGISAAEAEPWLASILEAWRSVNAENLVEPWDYRFRAGAAERELAEAAPLAALQSLNQHYYSDLGLDLAGAAVLYDLEPRAGKAPLAYTDYVRRGRLVEGRWHPTVPRVSASYAHGGMGPLNELAHENGHAAHMLALRTRPAFMDLGDPLFYEAFADVPSWSVYEPAWQQKYLGRSASEHDSLRALYSSVILDVAWALFDLRMLRAPNADPNVVWTELTARYLRIKPHPEMAWWAMRVQLVDKPGYMVNYGLGAIVTADIRRRIAARLGGFDTGNARWYAWLSEQLLGGGEAQETRDLLRGFLGGAPTPQALIAQLRRLSAAPAVRRPHATRSTG